MVPMRMKKTKIIGQTKTRKPKYDSAWKTVIKSLFKDFLEFFFPDIYQAIDFTKEVAFLDKELMEIDPNSTMGDRIADVLVKVNLKDGSIQYISIIIHVEVQGQPRSDFMERMFIYYYRAFDKEKTHQTPVISLAILTDDDKNYRPDEYVFRLFGFELRMKIPVVKITDYSKEPGMIKNLEMMSNPMSMVVLAQLKSHEAKHSDDEKKFEITKELIRQCYKKGYSHETTHIMLNFFDWVIRLPEVFKDRVQEVIRSTEEEKDMNYVPIWARDWMREGVRT